MNSEAAVGYMEELQRIFTQHRFLFSKELAEAIGEAILALKKQGKAEDWIKKEDVYQLKPEGLNTSIVCETDEETAIKRAYAKGWNDCRSCYIDNVQNFSPSDDLSMDGE